MNMSGLEIPTSGAALSFVITGGKWFIAESHSQYRGRVATYYRGVALESKAVENFYGQRVHRPFFSYAIKEEDEATWKSNFEKYGLQSHEVAALFVQLLHSTLTVVQVADERTRFESEMFAPTQLTKFQRRASWLKNKVKRVYMEKTKIKSAEEYFAAMQVSDMIMLPILKSLRRRHALLFEDDPQKSLRKFSPSEANPNVLTNYCLYKARLKLAERLVKQINTMYANARTQRTPNADNGEVVSSSERSVLANVREFLQRIGESITEEADIEFDHFLREKLVQDLANTRGRLTRD